MHLTWDPLRGCFILTGLLSLWMEVTSGFVIQQIPESPAVGQSVTLKVTGVTGTVFGVSWYKGSGTDSRNQILFYNPSTNIQLPGPQYFFRASPLPDGSLQISDLVTSDRGNYTVQIQANTQLQYTVSLPVYESVTKPVVTASTSQPQENGTVTLTCGTANAERILWGRGSATLPPGARLSPNNRTVTFSKISRSDAGGYQCQAENPISKSLSDTYTLIVSYGPDDLTLTGSVLVAAGSPVSLQCGAGSVPPATYKWRHNGTALNTQQSELRIPGAEPQDGGNYTCEVYNSVTQRSAAISLYVTVNGHTDTGGAEMGEAEIQYSSVVFNARKGHPVQPPPQNQPDTVYAEVKAVAPPPRNSNPQRPQR
ncbi:cell adhesion molecule CEACAM6-like isoform X3 [Ascaphus truei]|uniref:cell adhesion molecule CEACAM6-like isoform X3 n=1 Tax=Ascaphus truei TaxID=8439 RepID=UPI003F591F31